MSLFGIVTMHPPLYKEHILMKKINSMKNFMAIIAQRNRRVWSFSGPKTIEY
jgi:hypothetical protein